MRKSLPGISLLAVTGSLLLTGCIIEERRPYRRAVVVRETVAVPAGAPGAEVVVTQPPPPPQTEVIITRPGPAHVWIPGAWVWRGGWVWEPGRWALPPRAGVVWVPHRYVLRGGVHVYVHGGWR